MATKKAIQILVESDEKLSGAQARAVLDEMLDGKATDAQIGSFLTALNLERITPEILEAMAASMRSHALPCSVEEKTIDIVGTGGDGIDTFNVSTAASIIVAAAGGKVMKHGNRSNSSKCGSADLLEAFGARLDVDGEQAARVMRKAGFCFLFAQKFHPSMKHVGPVRRQLGIRSVFNILGPLTNPCVAEYQMSGVFREFLCPLYINTFKKMGVKRAMVCISEEGLDEISPQGTTKCWWLMDGKISRKDISPADFGLPVHQLTEVAGGEPEENVQIFNDILEGKNMDGPCVHYVLENAACALYVAGIASDLKDGVAKCRAAISSGKAKKVMDDYVRESNAVFQTKRPAASSASSPSKQAKIAE